MRLEVSDCEYDLSKVVEVSVRVEELAISDLVLLRNVNDVDPEELALLGGVEEPQSTLNCLELGNARNSFLGQVLEVWRFQQTAVFIVREIEESPDRRVSGFNRSCLKSQFVHETEHALCRPQLAMRSNFSLKERSQDWRTQSIRSQTREPAEKPPDLIVSVDPAVSTRVDFLEPLDNQTVDELGQISVLRL